MGRAVDRITELVPEAEHHLLSSGVESTDGRGAYAGTAALPDGVAARVRAVRAAVGELAPDVVHAHSSWAGLYTRVLRLPVPVVYQPHCYWFERPDLPGPLRRAVRAAERWLATHGSVVAAVSPHEERLARSLGARHVVRVPNAPSGAAVRRAGAGRAAPRGTPAGAVRTVATTGRVVAQKDPDFLARTARAARAAGAPLAFRWLGDGDPALVRRLTDAGVEVTGWLGADEVVRELAACDVYLHSAVYEGFPIAVLDAARVGLPVVVRAIPAFEGSGLTAVATPQEAAAAVRSAAEDELFRRRARVAGDHLVGEMDEAALHDGVLRAYRTAAGALVA